MKTPIKNKLFTWLVILLLIANTVSIAMFWLGKKELPPIRKGSPQEFLVKELKFTLAQQLVFDTLVKDHQQQSQIIRGKIKVAKDNFFSLLKTDNISDSTKQIAALEISENTTLLDVLTFNHFKQVRKICNEEQKKKFDEILYDVTNMIGQPHSNMRPKDEALFPPDNRPDREEQRPPPNH